MTLSETKARSLVLSFLTITQDFEKAKMCAEIAANLLLKEVDDHLKQDDLDMEWILVIYNKVKTEIEKL